MPAYLLGSAGELANLVGRGTLSVSSENSLFPRSNLGTGRPSRPFRFGAPGTNDAITLDGDLLKGAGACEALSSWAQTGTVALDASIKQAGATSIKITNTGSVSIDLRARAGETIKLPCYLRGDGTLAMQARIRNLHTGSYWNGSAWQAAAVTWASRSTASFAQSTATFTVEGPTSAKPSIEVGGVVTVRVEFFTSATGSAWVDEVYAWASAVNLLSLHGHTIPPMVAAEWRGSTDGFSGSDVLIATLTLGHPACYASLASPVDYRWHRLRLAGTTVEAAEVGELWIAQAVQCARGPKEAYELTNLEDDVANIGPNGETFVETIGSKPRRVLGIKSSFLSRTQYEEHRNELVWRSRGRAWPLVVVPQTDAPDVLLGRLDKSWKALRALPTMYDDADITLTESPFARRAV